MYALVFLYEFHFLQTRLPKSVSQSSKARISDSSLQRHDSDTDYVRQSRKNEVVECIRCDPVDWSLNKTNHQTRTSTEHRTLGFDDDLRRFIVIALKHMKNSFWRNPDRPIVNLNIQSLVCQRGNKKAQMALWHRLKADCKR